MPKTRSRSSPAPILGVLLVLAACSSSERRASERDTGAIADAAPETDAAPTADAASTPDAGRVLDAGAEIDAGTPSIAPCDPDAIVDLDVVGTRTDNVTRYIGSNEAASVGGAIYVRANPETVFAPVVHRYTPRIGTRLMVSLNNPGTPEDFFGRVWALGRCTSEPTAQLFDSQPPAGAFDGATNPVDAGVPIFIVVSGHARQLTGPFELSVTELPVVGRGEVCSLARRPTNDCGPGNTCVGPAFGEMDGTCEAEGADGTQCRTDGVGPACDDGLACGYYPPTFGTYCAPSSEIGAPCSPGNCVEGSYCSLGTCLAYGALDNQCRAQEPYCDDGLICSASSCRTSVTLGEDCMPPPGWGTKCVAGLTCVDGRCVEDGSMGANCRNTDAPCNEGLGCAPATSSCLPLTDLGGDCSANSCPGGTHCRRSRCIADGALGGTCRDGGDPCDVGLSCIDQFVADTTDHDSCQPVHEGDSCAPPRMPCPRGTVCAGSTDETTCMAATGTEGRPCRLSGRACDAGLFCRRPDVGIWYAPVCNR